MPLPPTRLRPRWLAAAAAVLAVAVLANYLHWGERAAVWFSQHNLSSGERRAAVWLPGYHAVVQAKVLEGLIDETSGLTYNPLTGTLFTVTGRKLLVELSRSGEVLRRIELFGFSDPEGVEVLGDGRMAIVDERRHQLSTFRLGAGVERIDADQLEPFDLGFADAGNKGFEGIAWDPHQQRLLLAKERSPMGLFSLPFPGEDGAAGTLQALRTETLFVRDLSSLTVDPRTGHTLVLSDESRLLLELDRQGRPVSFISLIGGQSRLERSIDQAEGVAIDEAGDIYLVAEPNLFYRFSPREDG